MFLSLAIAGLLVEAVVAQCPFYCACGGVTRTVDCRPSTPFQYTSIPDDAPVDTRVLIMTGNDITTIIQGNFSRYVQLEELYLNDNLLTEVQAEYFSEGLPQLTLLSLDGNPIHTISDGAFSNLAALQNLTLRNTMLSTVQAGAFIGLPNLQSLVFDGSPISDLPADVFTNIAGQSIVVSLVGTMLSHLPDDIFSSVDVALFNIDLSDNQWECDCLSVSLRDYLTSDSSILERDVICAWPLESRGVSITATTDPNTFTCYAPIILAHPQNASLLTEETATIACNISSQPRPDVVWLKDSDIIEYDQRVELLEDGSLLITELRLEDGGLYQCAATNFNGSATSTVGRFNISEATCFDGMRSSHETDIDCGGVFCDACNITQMCAINSDCAEELVCLYAYQLPSVLDYVSISSPLAHTCNTMEKASDLLQERAQSNLPQVLGLNFTFDGSLGEIQDQLKETLASQFKVSTSAITNTNIITVPRTLTPLVQIYFSVEHNSDGDEMVVQLRRQLHNGNLGGTLKITELEQLYNVRINI